MVDVQVAQRGTPAAVLALVAIACHEVSARQADGDARHPLVAFEVDDARDADRAAYDRNAVVLGAGRQGAPVVEIVELTALVDGLRAAPPYTSTMARRAVVICTGWK